MKTWTILLCMALLIPSLANASTCSEIANRINEDLTNPSGNIKDKHFSWMNLTWLKQQLGKANSKTTTDEITKYKWRSEEDGNYLIAYVNENGNVLRVSGQYSSDAGTGLFDARIPAPDLPAKKTPPVLIKTNVTKSDRLHDYNELFKTSFQTNAAFEDDMFKRIQLYYSSLRRCEKGRYVYALPVLNSFLYQTAIISEPKDGRCPVKISYVIPQIGKIDLKCSYDAETLQLFSDAEAKAAANTSAQSDRVDTLQTVTEKECKRYVDGVL